MTDRLVKNSGLRQESGRGHQPILRGRWHVVSPCRHRLLDFFAPWFRARRPRPAEPEPLCPFVSVVRPSREALRYLKGELQGSQGFSPVDLVDVHGEVRKRIRTLLMHT